MPASGPSIAGGLLISDDTGHSQDPHVERLIESFAFLTARLQVKLKDEFPELVDALLGMLYPHYLAPIPSMAIAQLNLDPAQGSLTTGPVIPQADRSVLARDRRAAVPLSHDDAGDAVAAEGRTRPLSKQPLRRRRAASARIARR